MGDIVIAVADIIETADDRAEDVKCCEAYYRCYALRHVLRIIFLGFGIYDLISHILLLLKFISYADWDLAGVGIASMLLPAAVALLFVGCMYFRHMDEDSLMNGLCGLMWLFLCPFLCWFMPLWSVYEWLMGYYSFGCDCSMLTEEDEDSTVGPVYKFFRRILEDVPQTCINIVFIVRHPNEFDVINVLAMVGSGVMVILGAILFKRDVRRIHKYMEEEMGDNA